MDTDNRHRQHCEQDTAQRHTIQKTKKMRNMDVDIQQHMYKAKHCNL